MWGAAVPVVRVQASPEAEAFYCDCLGFEVQSSYRPGEECDPAYLVLTQGESIVHLSSFSGDGEPGASVINLYVRNVDVLYENLKASGVEVGSA
ncbi:MAG: glyoxalase superfamily protein, partial [Bacteroidota bacterium]